MNKYYEHNGITFYNSDCLPAMKEMPDNAFDLAIVDPEYRDIDENQPTKDMRRNGGMKRFHGKPTQEYFKELFRVSKNQIIWGANNFDLPNYKGFVVWKKITISDEFTMSMAELAYISEGIGTTSKVFECAPQGTAKDPRIHPTQKPVALYKWLLTKYAKPGQTILDTHLGSMSSVIACIDMGYSITGYEVDKEYFDNGVSRVQRHLSQGRLFGLDFNLDIHYNEKK